MPNDSNAAAWAAAGQITSSSVNAMAQDSMNKKTRKFNEEWAYRQRDWALEDWHRQNEYNLPANVRQRMIEANLNPALMYGKGPGEMTSGPIRAGNSPSWNPQAPKMDLTAGSTIMTYLGVQRQTAELEQMQIQNDLLREKLETQKGLTQVTWNKAALTANENHKIEMWLQGVKDYNSQDKWPDGTIRNYMAEGMHNERRKQMQDYEMSYDENQRREIYSANNTAQTIAKLQQIAIQNAKTAAEIEVIKENFKLLEKSNILQDYQIDGERFLKNIGPAAQILRAVLSGK